MTTANHPDDDQLARFADADPEALGDSALSGHIPGCDRCRDIVDDLRNLRLALSAMPDPGLTPPRPLRLLPPVEPARVTFADRVGAVIRGAFAPVMTVGAALALVGVVGTSGITGGFQQAASGPAAEQAAATADDGEEGFTAAELETATPELAAEPEPDTAAGGEDAASDEPATLADPSLGLLERRFQTEEPAQGLLPVEGGGPGRPGTDTGAVEESAAAESALEDAPAELAAERPVWPMLLFSGIALMIGAIVLRWIFQPR
jgi:hypothetical protein